MREFKWLPFSPNIGRSVSLAIVHVMHCDACSVFFSSLIWVRGKTPLLFTFCKHKGKEIGSDRQDGLNIALGCQWKAESFHNAGYGFLAHQSEAEGAGWKDHELLKVSPSTSASSVLVGFFLLPMNDWSFFPPSSFLQLKSWILKQRNACNATSG